MFGFFLVTSFKIFHLGRVIKQLRNEHAKYQVAIKNTVLDRRQLCATVVL
jgi:hypothetical protein